MKSSEVFQEDEQLMLSTYRRLPLVIERGEGSWVFDPEGKRYLDCVAGLAVNIMGYGYQPLAEAVKEGAGLLLHASNLYHTVPQLSLAKSLCELSGLSRVFFNNSGAEANEVALKAARFYGRRKYGSRYKFLAFHRSFHGRTLLTISVTGQEKFHQDLEPLPEGILFARLNDIQSVEKVIDKEVCAIIVEPVQGEGGVYPAEKGFLRDVRALCDERDILLIFDEVQCGMGRTGSFFAFQHYEVTPDLVTLAKGLGGGLPIGAVLFGEKPLSVSRKGDQGSTFGGNPLACRAAKVMVEAVSTPDILQGVRSKGEMLQEGFAALKNRYSSIITQVRGVGLMWGVQVPNRAADIVQGMLERGVLVNAANPDTVRILPPLTITQDELRHFLKVFSAQLEAIVV